MVSKNNSYQYQSENLKLFFELYGESGAVAFKRHQRILDYCLSFDPEADDKQVNDFLVNLRVFQTVSYE